MFSLKISFFLLFFFCVHFYLSVVSGQKSCQLKEMDSCLTQFALSAGQIRIPETELSFRALCLSQQQLQQCLESYFRRCFSSVQREMVKWFSASLISRMRERCHVNGSTDGDVFRNATLTHAHCLNRLSEEQMRCVPKADLELAIQHNSLPIGCCVGRRAQQCWAEVNGRLCSASHAHFFSTFYSIEDLIQSFCPKEEEMNCKSIETTKKWTNGTRDKKKKTNTTLMTRVLSALFGQ